jgi:hypothetical protein
VLKTLFPDELQLGLAQATVAALAALLVVVAARRRGIHLQKELIIAMVRGLVQIVAVGSILLLLLHAPDWTGVLLLVVDDCRCGGDVGAVRQRHAGCLPHLRRIPSPVAPDQ